MQLTAPQARMGFDPRQWRPSSTGRPVTVNGEALLAEIATLQAENQVLRRELQTLRQKQERQQQQRHYQERQYQEHRPAGSSRVSSGSAAGISGERVDRWITAMARHPRWQELRLGPPAGLRGLIEALRRQWWNPQLSLEEELERRSPGLGAELSAALRGPHSRGRWAVRASFALHGVRAAEWLDEEPQRLVDELLLRLERLEQRPPPHQRRRGTRTENHSGSAGSAGSPGARTAADPRLQALQLLGLEPGASLQAIKRAYRRLAKAHHPDLGGDPQAFHRLDAAYRLLLG